MMKSHSNVVNISVSCAALKLLKLMLKEIIELEFPRIIQCIANLLKSRHHSQLTQSMITSHLEIRVSTGKQHMYVQ